MSASRPATPPRVMKSYDFVHTPSRAASPTRNNSSDHHSSSDSTATNSSDEFDWNEEDEEDKRKDPKKAKRVRRLWLLFLKLARPIRLLIFGVLGCALLLTPWLVFFFQFRSNSAFPHVRAWSFWLAISFAAAILTSLVLSLLPRIVLSLVLGVYGNSESLKTYIELFMAVSGWVNLALDLSWLWITLSVVRSQLNPPGSYWLYVNRVCSALFASGLLLLAEKIFLQFVAIQFHRKALAERLVENRLGLRALQKLSVAPASSSKQAAKKRAQRASKMGLSASSSLDILSHNSVISPSPLASPPDNEKAGEKKGRKRGENARDLKQKRKKLFAAQIVEQVGDVIGQVALKDSKFNREAEIGSLASARQLARQLFSSLSNVYPPRDHLIVEDFYPYFRDEQDATAAFYLFDKDGNGDISKREMREAVQRIYRERKALTASLKDMSNAVAKLDGVLIAVVLIAIGFLCLLIFNPSNTIESLVPLATIVLGFSFIFGHSAQLLFESLIFIFSTHPFDVGDLVLIDDQVLFVKEFGLFSTVFTRVDGQEVIAPNALLASSKLIHNVRRSNSMWETTNLHVAYDTPLQTIELLKTRLRAYMAENNREWGTPGCEVWIEKMSYQNYIQLNVAIEHRANWQNWGGRWERRTKFMRHMKSVLEELQVGYAEPLQPVTFHPASASLNTLLGNNPSPQLGGGFSGMSSESLGNAGGFGPVGSGSRGLAPNAVTTGGTANYGRY